MSFVVWLAEPPYAATDLPEGFRRVTVGPYIVETNDPADPTEQDCAARLAPADTADLERYDKALKALALVLRDWCNDLGEGTYANKTVADLRADFRARFQALP